MTVLDFFIVCDPPKTSHHAKRIVKRAAFASIADKPELVAAKQSLEALLLPFQPPSPITGPVSLSVVYTWPWLKGHTKRDRARGRLCHTSKPDLTNVTKTLEDRLVALRFIEDDRSVVDLHLSKFWGDPAGIAIRISALVLTIQQARDLLTVGLHP